MILLVRRDLNDDMWIACGSYLNFEYILDSWGFMQELDKTVIFITYFIFKISSFSGMSKEVLINTLVLIYLFVLMIFLTDE